MGCAASCFSKDKQAVANATKNSASKDKDKNEDNAEKFFLYSKVSQTRTASSSLQVTSSSSSDNDGGAWSHWRNKPSAYGKSKEFTIPMPSPPKTQSGHANEGNTQASTLGKGLSSDASLQGIEVYFLI
ncbi:hypothetical protein AC249_AIPGENE27049 [Exaiptasia diaphana]|nr:hypothetical protein AC249_AIPGENE27049 [Exaiptasia diaphana]